MSVFRKYIFLVLILGLALTLPAQKFADKKYYLIDSLDLSAISAEDRSIIDSCLKVFYAQNSDTSKVNTIYSLIELNSNDNVWPKYNRWMYEFALKKRSENSDPLIIKKFDLIIADALNNIGYLYFNQGYIKLALDYFQKGCTARERGGDKAGTAESLNNIGAIYDKLGNIPMALECFEKSLKLHQQTGDKKGMAYTYNNIGSIYSNQKSYKLALEYYENSLKLRKELGDKQGISLSYLNMGYIYQNINEYSLALEFLNKSLKLSSEMNNAQEIASSYNNIGETYLLLKDTQAAILYFDKSLAIREKTGDKNGLVNTLNNIGKVKLAMGKTNEALAYAKRGLAISQELGFPREIYNHARLLSRIAEKKGMWKEAFIMRELSLRMRDTLDNIASIKATANLQAELEYEKRKAITDKEHEKQMSLAAQQKEKQKIYTTVAIVGFILVLGFLIFVFNRLNVSRKQNRIIEQQKAEVEHQREKIEEAHKEITDSINYAERIQRSFLASEELLKENLKDHFVFFKPKDVVSGDFYWAHQFSNGDFTYVTADSTGHGVPGAIMSILNISSLERSVEKEREPAAILNTTRKLIIERLKKDGSAEGGKDGMDCSLIMIDKAKQQLRYTAANNPVWIVRENSLLELDPDKMPVGKHDNDHIEFKQHTVSLKPNDCVYTFTDGLPDQFGGPKGKKFMYKKFKELFITIAHLPMSQQKEKLDEALKGWKGGLDQVDDICVIGWKV